MNHIAPSFGDYDIVADACAIASRAWQRTHGRPWWDGALDGLAVACVWLVAGASLLVALAMGLGAAWLVIALAHVLWG